MNAKLLATFLLGALMASMAFNVIQYNKKDQGKSAAQPLPPEPFRAMDLSPAQIGVLNRCGTTCSEAAEELRSQTEIVTEDLRLALSAEVLDGDRVRELAAELSELRRKEIDNNIATLLEVRDVLEPKQVRTLYRVLYPDYEDELLK